MSRLPSIPTTDIPMEEDESMIDITLEPPTPFEAGASLQFNQSTPPSTQTLSALHQRNRGGSPHSTTSNHTFVWQDSLSQASTSPSRPTSTSGWSVSGTSVSGDDSLFVSTDNNSSAAISPSQGGKSKSHARKRAPGHVSRPRNAFILFRSHAITNNIIPPSLGVKDNRAVSCIVATLWKSLPEDEKKQWKSEAEKEKETHRKQYPDYQFKPGNCGTKGKIRAHAKTEVSVKEQCEIIADNILKAYGRSPTREEGEARKKKEAAAVKRASRNKDGFPRARRTGISRKVNTVDQNDEVNEEAVEIKQEEVEEPEKYTAPVILSTIRRRSSSLPFRSIGNDESETRFKRHQPSTDMFTSWQAKIEEHQQLPVFHQPELADESAFGQPSPLSFAGRRNVNPAALRFTAPTSFGDASFASPRTVTSGLSYSAPSPRYSLFNVSDRLPPASPISARRPDGTQVITDAMLLSPIKGSFYDERGGSIGWQNWSRYSYADIALPVMKPRQSIDSASSRRNSLFHRPSQSHFQGMDDNLFPQADSAHLSLHHNFFSPTFQSFHQRYTDIKRHEEDEPLTYHQDEKMPESPHPRIRRPITTIHTSTLADAGTTPSLDRLALHDH